jgi:glycosyltransferase involved in cell wall biosynthesis
MKSLSRLPKEKFHLEIVGSGDTDYIRSLISAGGLDENVTVVGRLRPGKEMLAWFDSLNLLVHPSKQEGLPRTVIEAMSRGCPVLASSIAGIPELLPERRLHPPGDHNMLRLQLLEFLDNSEFFNEDIAMNIERSKDYLFSVLENRRIEFWRNFFQRS